MLIGDLTDRQLSAFIKNYEGSGVTTGGRFALSDLRLERLRRSKSPFLPVETAEAIVRLAQGSADGLVSYKEIWQLFRPNQVWTGNAPRAEMAKALGAVIAFCVDNKLPILTALVVRADAHSQSNEAIANIYNEAKSLGVDVGLEPRAFVLCEQAAARSLTLAHIKELGYTIP